MNHELTLYVNDLEIAIIRVALTIMSKSVEEERKEQIANILRKIELSPLQPK